MAASSHTITRYGREWKGGWSELSIELACYRYGLKPAEGGLGPPAHFKNAVNMLWGEHNTRKKFVWHPWGEEMNEESCRWQYLGVSGCANSGKSDFFAVKGIVDWIADPLNTLVLFTSTSLKESRGRIWGSVEDYWLTAITKEGLPLEGGVGKLVSSVGLIRLDNPNGEERLASDKCSIQLIAGEKKKERETIGKLIGFKNHRVILIADELPELSHSILEAAYSNLAANDYFQLIGIGNPKSIYDPHGVFCRPKNGWGSVTPADFFWETERGYHIRFDAEQSPNVLANNSVYSFLPTVEKLVRARRDNGTDTIGYWRMWRAYWCPHGSSEHVYCEADIVRFDCEKTTVEWAFPPIKIAALDPAFTNGGDRSQLYFGLFGTDKDGKQTLLFTDHETLDEDALDKTTSRSFQIVKQFKQKCIARGVTPDCACYDATGAGGPFGDVIAEQWSRELVQIYFGGKPTKMPVSVNNRKPADEKYVDRVSEIWFCGQEFVRAGQLRGVSPDLGLEMTNRKYTTVKRGKDLILKIEPKPDMRMRVGKSPDLGDAAFMLLDLCRSKFKFRALTARERNTKEKKTFKSFKMKMDVTTRSGNFLRAAA